MNNFPKEPNIKLIPSDPMTNTILIIYCVSSTGASVPYKSSWRRVNPKLHKVEDIKHHSGSSYRCSPLDIDYVIEATIYFQHQNVQMKRIVQSNVVKVSRQLKEKRIVMKQPIVARLITLQVQLDLKLAVHDSVLSISSNNPSFQPPTLNLPINQLGIQAEANQLVFRMIFKHRIEDFLNFIASLIGNKPKLKNNNQVLWNFANDLNRDIILLGIAEILNKVSKYDFHGSRFPVTARNMTDKNGKNTSRNMDPSKSPNRSQTSVSPKPTAKDVIPMKKSFTRGGFQIEKKEDHSFMSSISHSKLEQKNKKEEKGEYLNVFDDDELQLLNAPITPSSFQQKSTTKAPVSNADADKSNDGPSINLRGSFQQLQKSFSSNVNQQTIDRVFGIENNDANKKMQEQLTRLRKQNESLKKQVQSIAFLTKQNNSIKRKYLEMKQQVNRLQMQRKVILTDKLRCQVNWHKQIQEKQSLKKEVEHLRQIARGNNAPTPNYMERSTKAASYYEHAGYDKNDTLNRSHNTGYHH